MDSWRSGSQAGSEVGLFTRAWPLVVPDPEYLRDPCTGGSVRRRFLMRSAGIEGHTSGAVPEMLRKAS